MGANELNKNNPTFVGHGNNKTVRVTPDVKYHPVVPHDTRVPVLILYILRHSPCGVAGLLIPSLQRLFRVRMLFPIIDQAFFRDYPHCLFILVPVWD